MKKGVWLLFFAVLVFSLYPASAFDIKDFQGQLNRATYYAKSYEEGNNNYAQFKVYSNAVEEDLNFILRSMDESEFTKEDLRLLLGEPDQTSWVLSEDGANEIQISKPVSIWTERQIFDGEKIQQKISVIPVSLDNGKIIYKAGLIVFFKRISASFDIKAEIAKIKKLSQTFSLDSTNLNTANELAEASANLEKVSEAYFEQTNEECEQILSGIFGEENKKTKEDKILKVYLMQNKKNYKVTTTISICEKCEKEKIGLDIIFEKDGQEVQYTLIEATPSFDELGVNGVKEEMIRLNGLFSKALEAERYGEAYTYSQQIEALNDYWNKQILQETAELAIADRTHFFNGLFEGYSLISTAHKESVVYEMVLVREYNESGKEICNNNIDDNQDNKTDCQDELCSGQICGTKEAVINENGTITNRTVELYCISRTCQEKPQEDKPAEKRSVCRNKICEEGEAESCKQDCTTCPLYEPAECLGKLIFKGEDVNGCELEPICVKQDDSCKTTEDCDQPLCGKSECVLGACKITTLSPCSASKCVDGNKKIQVCTSGEKIITEICFNGVWKKTGAECVSSLTAPSEVTIEPIRPGTCTSISECAAGFVCNLGRCEQTILNTKPAEKSSITKVQSSIVTGKIVEITGGPITGLWPTGVVPEPAGNETEPANLSTVPKRVYNGEQERSILTGIVRQEEHIQKPALTEKDLSSGKFKGNRELSSEVTNEFVLVGKCEKSGKNTVPSLSFSGAGDKFGAIIELKKQYETAGKIWANWGLENLLKERAEIVKSFNNEFLQWFVEKNLANNADRWQSKEQSIRGIYSNIVDNQVQIGKMMNILNINELTSYDIINLDYEQENFVLKYNEEVKNAKIDNNPEVKLISPYMEVSILVPEDFIKGAYKNAMNSYQFPGSSLMQEERKSNNGLTDEEKLKFDRNDVFKQKIKAFIEEQGIKDGVINVQFSVVDENKEDIYNVYLEVSPEEFKIQPMPFLKTPTGFDVKITASFEKISRVLSLSNEKTAKQYKFGPPWESGFNPGKTLTLFVNWAKMQVAMNSLMNSVEISPANKQGAEDLFIEAFYLIAQGSGA